MPFDPDILDQDSRCIFCFEGFVAPEMIQVSGCGKDHIFHMKCWNGYLVGKNAKDQIKCPQCVKVIDKKVEEDIFMILVSRNLQIKNRQIALEELKNRSLTDKVKKLQDYIKHNKYKIRQVNEIIQILFDPDIHGDKVECPICFEHFKPSETIVQLGCSHQFCLKCWND